MITESGGSVFAFLFYYYFYSLVRIGFLVGSSLSIDTHFFSNNSKPLTWKITTWLGMGGGGLLVGLGEG